jgi:hypothetical protein
MGDFVLIDRIRSRVFLVPLPGMTPRHERFLIRNCRRLANNARAEGLPLPSAWGPVSLLMERVTCRLRTEQERETFVAIMQRLHAELFQERQYASR